MTCITILIILPIHHVLVDVPKEGWIEESEDHTLCMEYYLQQPVVLTVLHHLFPAAYTETLKTSKYTVRNALDYIIDSQYSVK